MRKVLDIEGCENVIEYYKDTLECEVERLPWSFSTHSDSMYMYRQRYTGEA